MSGRGTVEAVYVAPDSGDPMQGVESVEAVAGRGLRGDRYFHEQGLYDRREELSEGTDVSLIGAEALAAVAETYDLELDPAETRRNVLTRDVALNHLVDREFRVGEATLVGRRLCEPCSYMAGLADVDDAAGAVEALTHRGGLNADVVETGEIAVGDAVAF